MKEETQDQLKINNYKNYTMETKYHLLLDRSEYATTDIEKLEKLLLEYAISEGVKNCCKSSIQPINEIDEETKLDLWIEDNKLNGEDVTFIHWYSNIWYIIQTN